MDLDFEKCQNKKKTADEQETKETDAQFRNLDEHSDTRHAKIARIVDKTSIERNIKDIYDIIKQSDQTPIQSDEVIRYVVNNEFLNDLEAALAILEETDNEIHIPSLTNRKLLADHCVYTTSQCNTETLLKSNIKFSDVSLVSEVAWEKLESKIPSIDAKIPRNIIKKNNQSVVELQPIKLWIMFTTPQNPHKISAQPLMSTMSRLTKIRKLQTEFDPTELYIANCVSFESPPKTSSDIETIKLVSNSMMGLTFQELGLADSCAVFAVVSVSGDEAKNEDPEHRKIDLMTGGLAGLQNFGNLCFMNSALQCLSHTMPLTQFFFSGAYKNDVNLTNPLGTKGKLVSAYVSFLKEAWMKRSNANRIPVLNPDLLKETISRFAPQFYGYQQQDSHELIAYLLDGLHEDLNRVKEKKYVEYKDDDNNIPDEQLAEISWYRHKSYNDSIIVDIFQGLYKSRLECLNCKHYSVAFDPFMYLSLPLPAYQTITILITIIPNNSALRWAVQFDVNACFGDTLLTLKKQIAHKFLYILKNSDISAHFEKTVYASNNNNPKITCLKSECINEMKDTQSAYKSEKNEHSFSEKNLQDINLNTSSSKLDNIKKFNNLSFPAFPNRISPSIDTPYNEVFHPKVNNENSNTLFLCNNICQDLKSSINDSIEEILKIPSLYENMVILKPTRSNVYRYWDSSSIFCHYQANVEDSFANAVDPVYVYLLPTANAVNLLETVDVDTHESDIDESSENSSADENYMYKNLEQQLSYPTPYEMEESPNFVPSTQYSEELISKSKNSWSLDTMDFSTLSENADKLYIFVLNISFGSRYTPQSHRVPTLLITLKQNVTCSAIYDYITWRVTGQQNKVLVSRVTYWDPLNRCPNEIPYEQNLTFQTLVQQQQKRNINPTNFSKSRSEIYMISCSITSMSPKTDPLLIYTWNQFMKSEKETIVDVKTCIREFLKQEQLGADNMWYCKKCKKQVQANKQLDIWQLPRILVIQLKRFHQTTRNYRSKNNQYITLKPSKILDLSEFVQHRRPENKLSSDYTEKSPVSTKLTSSEENESTIEEFTPLSLSYNKDFKEPFKTDAYESEGSIEDKPSLRPTEDNNNDTKDKNNKYMLFAISNHYGSLAGGHYTATVKCNFSHPNSKEPKWKWISFDDSSVTYLSSESEICGKSAYLLFYERV